MKNIRVLLFAAAFVVAGFFASRSYAWGYLWYDPVWDFGPTVVQSGVTYGIWVDFASHETVGIISKTGGQPAGGQSPDGSAAYLITDYGNTVVQVDMSGFIYVEGDWWEYSSTRYIQVVE